MAQALRDELMAVPGIAGAEVESDEGVAGVRVQLAEGADPEEVGAAVRRILSQHGMRAPEQPEADHRDAHQPATEQLEAGAAGGPPPPPGAPGSVVSFPLVGEHAKGATTAEPAASDLLLESVAVEETPQGVAVLVRAADGTRAASTPESGMAGLDAAVVAAVAELTGAPPLRLVEIIESTSGEWRVLTAVLALEGALAEEEPPLVGSAVQTGGRAYAVARAAWEAATSRV
ncbi:MAG: hypothetical protein QNJ77_07260 [Acidimicrobiia bacterium]|nr:hypothetical protein [Acidimicrobiia bacterium]